MERSRKIAVAGATGSVGPDATLAGPTFAEWVDSQIPTINGGVREGAQTKA